MRKPVMFGIAVLAGALGLMAALPQDAQAGALMKISDRCREMLGAHFHVDSSKPFAIQQKDGAYTLVAVGVDYLEFTTDRDRTLLPLSSLVVILDK